jgi:hypothetical protein
MPRQRYCPDCLREVTCHEEQREVVVATDRTVVDLTCSRCGRHLGTLYPTL